MNDTPTTEPKKRTKKSRAPRDPNRVPVKRERSEMYGLVGKLETAKKKRAKLAKRLAIRDGIIADLAAQDEEIARINKRMGELIGESAATESVETGSQPA